MLAPPPPSLNRVAALPPAITPPSCLFRTVVPGAVGAELVCAKAVAAAIVMNTQQVLKKSIAIEVALPYILSASD